MTHYLKYVIISLALFACSDHKNEKLLPVFGEKTVNKKGELIQWEWRF